MNQRKLVALMVAVVLLLVGVAVYFATRPDTVVEKGTEIVSVAVGTTGVVPQAAKGKAKTEERSRWVRVGPGTVVGVLREYGSDRPIDGAEVTLEAGLPGPNELLKAKTRADGGFTFEKVTNFDSWTLRAKAPPPLADAELAGVGVIENKQTDLGTVYLAPTFGVPGTVVDEKDAPIAGATVRAIRGRPPGGGLDVLRLIRELPRRPVAVDQAVSNENGKFELRKVPPGRYDFTVEKAGYQLKVEKGSIITPESKNHPLRFVLVQGFQADGRVVRESGGPVVGLPIVAFAEPGNAAQDFSAIDKVLTTTDAKGAFHLDGLGGGRYVVAVSPEGEPSVVATDVTIPSKKLIEITLKGDAWLEGDITGDGGKPIPDAQVYALTFDNKSPTVGNVKSDAAGHYVMHGLQSGPIQLFLVQADGYGNYPEDLSGLMRGPGGSDVKLVPGRNEKSVSLGLGGIIRGLVKEKDSDAPVAGARVELGSILTMFGGSRVATTGADGKFEITSVPKGAAVLMVSKEGWFQPGVNPQSVMMVLGSRMQGGGTAKDSGKGATVIVSEPGEVIERTMELAHGSVLSGVVSTPDGQPVSGAQVSLVLEGDNNGMGRMLGGLFPMPEPRLSDAQGHYEIPGPPPGEKARVVARSTGYLDGKSDVVTCAPGDAKTGVGVKLRQGATLTGKVHDENGRPIDGALVRWTSIEEDAQDWSVRWRLRSATPSVTDSKGEFRIPNVETGKLALQATDTRHLSWSSNQVAAEDGKEAAFDIVLKSGGTLDGRVLGSDGKGASNATVSFNRQGDKPADADPYMEDNGEVSADTTGNFHAEALIPGRYSIVARAPGAAPSEAVESESGGTGITLQLTQAFSISGVVRMKSGGGVADVEVALEKHVTVKGDDGKTSDTTSEVESVRTGADGSFELKDVPGGNYDLQARVGWGASPRPNVVPTTVKDVAAGRQALTIEVEAGLTISGTVIGEDGKPVLSGWVWANSAEPNSTFRGVGDSIDDGTFEVTGLAPGKYRLDFNTGGQRKSQVAEAGAKDIRIEFGGGGSVKVLVTKDGVAAPNIQVYAHGDQGDGSAHTDQDGRAEIKGLAPGTYTVETWMNTENVGFHAQQENVAVVAGTATAEIGLALEKRQ